MANAQEIIERLPLFSHRGNFTGKPSAPANSVINGSWWRSDPITGGIPDYVQRNSQFYINQGFVDQGNYQARDTSTFSTLNSNNPSNIGSYRYKARGPEPQRASSPTWYEVYIYHPVVKPIKESWLRFSTVPTRY